MGEGVEIVLLEGGFEGLFSDKHCPVMLSLSELQKEGSLPSSLQTFSVGFFPFVCIQHMLLLSV